MLLFSKVAGLQDITIPDKIRSKKVSFKRKLQRRGALKTRNRPPLKSLRKSFIPVKFNLLNSKTEKSNFLKGKYLKKPPPHLVTEYHGF